MPYVDPQFEARRKSIIAGTANTQTPTISRPITGSNGFTDPTFEKRRIQILQTPVQPVQPIAQPAQNTTQDPGFLDKAGKFLGITTGELGNAFTGAKNAVTGYNLKNAPADLLTIGKNTLNRVKSIISNESEKYAQQEQQYRVDNNIPDYQALSYDQIRDYNSVGMLKLAQGDIAKDLEVLKAKPNKNKLDEYRIKNIQGTLDQINETLALSPDQRKKKEVFINGLAIGRLTGDAAAGFLGSLEGVADFIKWRGDVADAKGASSFGETTAKRLDQWAKEVAPNNPNLADELVQGGGSTLAFYIPGAGVSSATAKLASISPKLAALFGVTASATLEAATESGNTYTDLLESGASRDEADLAASRVFAGNIIFNVISDKVGLFSDDEGVKKILTTALSEGSQEAYQDGLQAVAQKKDLSAEQLAKTFFIGAVVGGGMGSVIQDASVNENLNDEDRKKLAELAEKVRKVEAGEDPEMLGFEFVNNEKPKANFVDPKVFAESIGGEVGSVKNVNELEIPEYAKGEISQQQVNIVKEQVRNGDKIDPVVVDRQGNVLDGAHKLTAFKEMGVQDIQTVIRDEAGSTKQEFDYSSTQLDLPAATASKMTEFANSIPDTELYKDPEANYGAQVTGRENEPHITVLYGLNTTNEAEVRKIVEQSKPIEVKLGKVSTFETNEDYDVLKVDVISKELQALNQKLDDALETPGKTFDTYQPHVTIAYVKKGEGAKYVGDTRFEGQTIILNDLTFSSKDGKRVNIPLIGKTAENQAVKEVDQAKKPYQRTLNLANKDDVEYLKRIFSDQSVEDMKKGIFKYGTREGKSEIEAIVKNNIINEPVSAANVVKKEVKDILSKSKKIVTKESITVYHGGNKEFTDKLLAGEGFDPQAKREAGTGGNFYGLSTTTKKSMADNFSTSSGGTPSIVSLTIKEGARALELSNNQDEFVDEYSEDALKELSKSYDIIIDKNNAGGENEIRILNPQILEETKTTGKEEKPIKKAKSRLKQFPSVFAGLANKGADKIHNFELRKPPVKGTEEFKLHKKITELIRKYAQTIGEGYTPRNALGVYFPKTKNIRINNMNNVAVAAHEIAHFLDYANGITDKLLATGTPNIVNEIKKLYQQYYPIARPNHQERLQALEGFATLLQKYTEQPTTITQEYPSLVKEFLQPGGKHYVPVVGEILTDLNQMIGEYQDLPALDKIGARVTSEGTNINKPSFLNFWQKLRTEVADEVYPVEILAKKGKVGFTKEDPSLWVRAYNAVSGIVNNNISTDRGYWAFTDLQNGWQKKYDFNWKSLIESTQRRGITDSFANYLVSRREYFLYQELDQLEANKNIVEKIVKAFDAVDPEKMTEFDRDMKATLAEDYGIDLSETEYTAAKKKIQALYDMMNNAYLEQKEILDKDGFKREEIEEAYAENKERFKDEETMFDALSREDLALMNNPEVQLLDNKTFNQLKSKEGYASFKRQFYDEIVGDNDAPGVARVGGTKVSSLINRTGSERTIINPLYSAIANHSEIVRKSMKQVVYNQIGKLGASAIMPTIMQVVPLQTAKQGEKIIFPQEKDNNVVMARQNYKRVPVLMDGEIKTIIDSLLTHKNVDTFTQLYTGLSRLFTAGTTGLYPSFALTNFMVDQITATANSYNKFRGLYTPIKEMLKVWRQKNSAEAKYFEEYLVMGGERQTFSGWQRLEPKDLFKRVADEKNKMEAAIDMLQKGVDILSIPAAKSEIFSRASEYINARKAGKSQIVALEEAGRVTAPFHHIGAWGAKEGKRGFGQTYIKGLPFFNASIQVLDQTARVAATPEGKKRMAFVTIAVTAAYLSAIMAMMDASDDQKEQYKDLEAEDLANFIYFPNPSGDGLIRVKMASTFSIPGTVINMAIANKMFGARYGARDVMEAATAFLPDQLNPTDPVKAILGWIPQVFKPVSHVIFNVKEYPTVSALVGMGLSRKPAALQYNEGTSVFAKKLGELLNVSPIKVDYLLTGYLGRAAGFLTGKPGIYNLASSIMRDYYFTSGKRVREFYDIKEKNDGEYTAYQNLEKGYEQLPKDKANEIYRKKVITDTVDELLGEYRDIDPKVDQEKAAKVRAKIILEIEKLYSGDKPNGYNKYVFEATKRRNKNKLEKK